MFSFQEAQVDYINHRLENDEIVVNENVSKISIVFNIIQKQEAFIERRHLNVFDIDLRLIILIVAIMCKSMIVYQYNN